MAACVASDPTVGTGNLPAFCFCGGEGNLVCDNKITIIRNVTDIKNVSFNIVLSLLLVFTEVLNRNVIRN